MDLSDFTLLDLSWLLPGPYGTMLLGDMGMEVIKIERPGEGDYARWIDPKVGDTGLSHVFHTVNRNKKSVAIDLSTNDGRAAFLELAAEADAVFEQFRPGVVDKLDVGYEDVREVNEDIVYCSLTGYGQTGPYSDRVGHDINYAAIAGLLDKTRSFDGSYPAQPGYPVGDMAGGMFAAFAICMGLLNRAAGNGGQYLDVAMTDVILSMATGQEWAATIEGEDPDEHHVPPEDLVHPAHNVYRTQDGEFVTIACVEEKFWERLLEELDRTDLRDYQFERGEDGEYATAELQEEFATRTRAEWEDLFSDEVPFAPVNRFEEIFDHPQVRARNMLRHEEIGAETVAQLGVPLQTSGVVDHRRRGAPELGEHTRPVLEEVLPAMEIDRLSRDGVIHTHQAGNGGTGDG
jgi:crotonobetainyl-CoA:carnitine CoA-transferase CaiB-like acyl-CoA transferase